MWNKLKNLIKNRKDNNKEKPINFSASIDKNEELIKKKFTGVGDLIFRELYITAASGHRIKSLLFYIDNLVDKNMINNNIIEPLLFQQRESGLELGKGDILAENIAEKIINAAEVKQIKNLKDAANALLTGSTILLVDGINSGFNIITQGWKDRQISPPEVERAVRGPKIAFTENINYNLGSIRRIIKSSSLKIEYYTKGLYSQTKIAVIYLEGIANKKIVNEVKKRINSINVGYITGCTHVMELIEDNPLSLFDSVYETERVDVLTGGIMEGRIAVITDGCPTSLMAPKLFMENFISPDDYHSRFWYTLIIRSLRFLGFIISTMLPAFYIAIISFHQELLPMTLVRTIYTSREGVPFPIVIEMLLFLFFFESIKEAGARIPSSLGAAISIVGALILGQAAITAGFLSPDGVIIGAITGIAIFLTPLIEFNQSLIILRIIFILAAGLIGFYGITLIIFLTTAHLCAQRSFGIPITSPVAPLHLQDLKDFIIRVPYLLEKTRPVSLETENIIRQGNEPVKRYFFKYRLDEEEEKK